MQDNIVLEDGGVPQVEGPDTGRATGIANASTDGLLEYENLKTRPVQGCQLSKARDRYLGDRHLRILSRNLATRTCRQAASALTLETANGRHVEMPQLAS